VGGDSQPLEILKKGVSIGEIAGRLDRTEVAVKFRIRKPRKCHPERFKSAIKQTGEKT